MRQNGLAAEALAMPLDEHSLHLRRLVVGALVAAGRGHLGSAMSLIEILRVLYDEVLRVRPEEPNWPERDRCILSKGHGCLALYAVLAEHGFFSVETLKSFCKHDSILGGHPEFGMVPGVEASTGSLGHGLSIGVGLALAARMKGRNSRTIVILGDGELNEGSVWEAALSASKHRLTGLTAVIDYNHFQSYGPTTDVQDLEPLSDKWSSFGFLPIEVNGHDVTALRSAFGRLPLAPDRPGVIICHTVKGKGVDLAQNNAHWHHKNRLTEKELTSVRETLGQF